MSEENIEVLTLSITTRPLAEALAVERMLAVWSWGPGGRTGGPVCHQRTFLKQQELRTFVFCPAE